MRLLVILPAEERLVRVEEVEARREVDFPDNPAAMQSVDRISVFVYSVPNMVNLLHGASSEVRLVFVKRGFPEDPTHRSTIERLAWELADTFTLSIEAAVDLALQQRQHVVLLAGGLQSNIFPEAASMLQTWRSVIEYAKVWGQFDLLGRLHVPLFELQCIQRYLLVTAKGNATQHVYYLRDWLENVHAADLEEVAMKAWILIKAPGERSQKLMDTLKGPEFPQVVQMGAVYGEDDVILQVEVANNAELSDLIFKRIQPLGEVEATKTFICVEDTYWRR